MADSTAILTEVLAREINANHFASRAYSREIETRSLFLFLVSLLYIAENSNASVLLSVLYFSTVHTHLWLDRSIYVIEIAPVRDQRE